MAELRNSLKTLSHVVLTKFLIEHYLYACWQVRAYEDLLCKCVVRRFVLETAKGSGTGGRAVGWQKWRWYQRGVCEVVADRCVGRSEGVLGEIGIGRKPWLQADGR